MRSAQITRTTKETDITLKLTLLEQNKPGKLTGTTDIAFFDHMLNSFFTHGGFDAEIDVKGDLVVDGHHTVEDLGIVLGMALANAAGDRVGIKRFSDMLMPMDETLVMCAVDYSGRAYCEFDCPFTSDVVGTYETQLTVEFFRALCINAGINLHLKCLYGQNDHHKTEALYKAAGKCIGDALKIVSNEVLSTKGVL